MNNITQNLPSIFKTKCLEGIQRVTDLQIENKTLNEINIIHSKIVNFEKT